VLVAAHADGRIRYIGVSNYTAAHLRAMLDGSSGPVQFPHVLQMEFHPEYWRVAMQLHKEFMLQGMKIEGYAVLGEGRFANQDPCSPAVQRIAARLGATAPQVILGWALRKGVRVLVMSRNSEHLVENLAAETVATSMTAEDDIAIDESSSAEDRKICWDPSKVA
jgi:2,5-diketo-D-gluconate reductase A